MFHDLLAAHRRATLALVLAAGAALTVTGCAAGEPTESTAEVVEPDASVTEEGDEASEGESGEASMPDDFPQDLFLPDGELVSAVGSDGSWVIVRTIQLVDQARVAVESNVTSYGFTIDEHVDDGEYSSWTISNDKYDVLVDLRPGSPVTVTYVVDVR